MTEVVFVVEEDADGGYVAAALNESIVTEADTLELLREQVRDAVRCHFGDDQAPAMVRLHFVRDEVLAL